MMMPVDKIGQEIAVGAYIVYGHALGRSAGLRLGKVLAINDNGNFTIIGVDAEWSHRQPSLLSKKSTIKFNDRIVVLSPDKVPDNIKTLLDGFNGG
jgi:hypothetical protein